MDLAKVLVRSCVRAFYKEENRHVAIVDALVIHSALNDADLGLLIGCQPKEVHKLTGKLREHRFIAVHTRPELREGQQRPINRTWYYIDYRATIDAIKWRVYLIDKQVQGNTVKEQDRKEYFCKRCTASWTQMEVLDKHSPAGFLCHRCDYLLVHDPDHNRGGHEQSTKLNAQFKFITDLLPKIDEVVVPENTFDQALAVAVKVQRDEYNPVAESVAVSSMANRPTAVSGMKQEGPTHINISFGDGPSEADIAADKAKKAQIATQNALPVHFTHSTVTGEQVKFGPNAGTTFTSEVDDKKTIVDASNADDDNNEEDMKAYWARVKEEQEREAERARLEDEEEDEDDDEDEFEDVVPTASASAVGTPLGTGPENKLSSLPQGLTSALKRGGSASASGTSTGATSPATGPGTPDDGRPAKKVRIEEPETVVKEEEESEEEEFEDV